MPIKSRATIVPTILLTVVLLSVLLTEKALSAPDGPHCIGSGPISLPADYCGCTWGAVYYRGQPIKHAPVFLAFDTQNVYTTTQASSVEPFPFYTETGNDMGAKLNDVMTATTTIAGQTVTRPFRARPDSNGEQEVALIVPERGAWVTSLANGYGRVLAAQGSTVWAGGAAGLIAIDSNTATTTTHNLPWPDQSVVSVAVGGNNQLWAAGPRHLAEFDGTNWHDRSLPFAAKLRAMAIDPATGTLWVAGWGQRDDPGSLASYTGTWQIVDAISQAITALAVDSQGNVWAGTWGGGVFRSDKNEAGRNTDWTQYTTENGLASDEIYDITVDVDNVWFAASANNINSQNFGGVSRYTLSTGEWQTFTPAQGLPYDPLDPSRFAPIYSIASGADGQAWVGTETLVDGDPADAIYTLIADDLWVQDTTMPGNRMRDIVTVQDTVLAAGDSHLLRLDQGITPGNPPTAQITTAPLTITLDSTLVLSGTATDGDEEGGRILGWEWMSDQAGHLCTTANQCVVPGQLLGEGTHQIQLRVVDDEGVWSLAALVGVTVVDTVNGEHPKHLYLPAVHR